MRGRGDRTAALAAALWPGEADALLARAPPPLAAEGRRLAELPERALLSALAASLGADGVRGDPFDLPEMLRRPAAREGERWPPLLRRLALEWRCAAASVATAAPRSAARTTIPAADGPGAAEARDDGRSTQARLVNTDPGVRTLDIPRLAPGLAEVDGRVRSLGARAAEAAGSAVGALLEKPVRVEGRLLPGAPAVAAAVSIPVELTAIGEHAVVAVDCSLAAAAAAMVAGSGSSASAARVSTPAEVAVLEVLLLGALQGIASIPEIESALAPRLGLRLERPVRPVAVALEIDAGGRRGQAALALPARALQALRGRPALPASLEEVEVPVSVLSGSTTVPAGEVAAARRGDVVPLDVAPGGEATARWPGGGAVRGRLADHSLEVEEVDVSEISEGAAGLPVRLVVDLGPVAVPLRELARVVPGGLLPLPVEPRGRVTLRLADRAIARGELVDLDDGLGVRILDVVASP